MIRVKLPPLLFSLHLECELRSSDDFVLSPAVFLGCGIEVGTWWVFSKYLFSECKHLGAIEYLLHVRHCSGYLRDDKEPVSLTELQRPWGTDNRQVNDQ